MELIKPGLDTVHKCFLSLMAEFDNEELVESFESIILIFSDEIQPYAANICRHLSQQYLRCMAQDKKAAKYDTESRQTAIASFSSITKVLEVICTDVALVLDIEQIIMPCLIHVLTQDAGVDSLEECIDCVALIVHHGYKDKERAISEALWGLHPHLLRVCCPRRGDSRALSEVNFEYITQIAMALRNYITRDPEGMLKLNKVKASKKAP